MTRLSAALLLIALLAIVAGHAGSARAGDPGAAAPVVAAVGDLACSPNDPNFNAGDGTAANCAELRVSDAIAADPSIDRLFALGDIQYGCADPADYAASYTPTYGRLLGSTNPAAGNHEYNTVTDPGNGSSCPDANNMAQDYFGYFGAPASPQTGGHYSFDLGSWHVIVLNANCSNDGVGGCGTTSPQTQWLASDLAADTQPCTLAYWHQPRWTGEPSNNSSTSSWWNLLYQHHADLVLNGHIHNYARFPLLSPSGQPDPNGVREVIIGTGGESLLQPSASASPLPTVAIEGFGFLRLVLGPTGYTAAFEQVDQAGAVSTGDTFSGMCHNAPPALSIGQTVSSPVPADSQVTYTVTVTNTSASDQSNVTVADTLPPDSMLDSSVPSQGSCTGNGPISCNLGTVAAGASASVQVTVTPILPRTLANGATATSDQEAAPVASSQPVTVTAAPGTSYVAVTSAGFGAPSPRVAVGTTLQWSFVGAAAQSATDSSGMSLFADTGLVTPVNYAHDAIPDAGVFPFTDTATGSTTTIRVPVSVPPTGTLNTPFVVTWAAAPLGPGLVEDVQVSYPGSTTWASLVKKTTLRSTTFTPAQGFGGYRFRARLRNTGTGAATAYSPAAVVTVS